MTFTHNCHTNIFAFVSKVLYNYCNAFFQTLKNYRNLPVFNDKSYQISLNKGWITNADTLKLMTCTQFFDI